MFFFFLIYETCQVDGYYVSMLFLTKHEVDLSVLSCFNEPW